MRRLHVVAALWLATMLLRGGGTAAAQKPVGEPQKSVAEKRFRLVPAFIIDDRLAALRRAADLQSEVRRRLRLARPVYLIETKAGRGGAARFYRVAISRRMRGWLHEAALAVPGRAGDDARVVKMIETFSTPFDKLTLCRLIADHFPASPLRPRVLLLMAEAAEGAAAELNRTAHRRLQNLTISEGGAQARDYFLSDTGLDRYTRLRIRFDYSETTRQFVYDGQAYREILRRFPHSKEAERARQQWPIRLSKEGSQ